ncbi:hypothetical protein Dimus_028050 [Dionaea muscipula]
MVAAAASTAPNLKAPPQSRPHPNPIRPPLLPSGGDDNVATTAPHRRPKSREVTSRYLLSTSSSSSTSTSSYSSSSNSSHLSSRRFASPINSRAARPGTPLPDPSVIRRSQSVERRRPGTPRPNGAVNGGEIPEAVKMLVSSRRSLSVSFQGESFSMPINKVKQPASPNVRKGTPEGRRASAATVTTPRKEGDQGENARLAEKQRWPARSRQLDSVTSVCKSVDLGNDRKKLTDGSGHVVRALHQSLTSETLADDKLRRDLTSAVSVKGACVNVADSNLGSMSALAVERTVSDVESVSSEGNCGVQENGSVVQGRGGTRTIVVPARFLQETNSRLRRAPDMGSSISSSNVTKATVMPKPNVPKKSEVDSRASSPRGSVSRGLSPLRGALRTASPSKLGSSLILEKSSPSRGLASPTRVRNAITGVLSYNMNSTPSVLSFGADVRRGKVGENRIDDAHFLRLLYNRQLQWRFVNARSEAVLSIQKLEAERSLYNAWKTTSDLRGAVSAKRKELQWMRQKLKLTSILKGQILYLEEWAIIEMDLSSSLSGAIESLKASIVQLPLLCGAKADIKSVKDAICSSLDVIQAMPSSICSMLSKVEEMNMLVGGVAGLSSKGRVLLDECKDILSTLAAMQVKDCSLRTHMLQIKRPPSSLTVEVLKGIS